MPLRNVALNLEGATVDALPACASQQAPRINMHGSADAQEVYQSHAQEVYQSHAQFSKAVMHLAAYGLVAGGQLGCHAADAV